MESIKTLFNFRINESDIETPGNRVMLYRFFPPNLSILTDWEKETEIESLSSFLDSIFMPFQFFGMDKAEDLNKHKEFFQNALPEYAQYTGQIVDKISDMETNTNDTNSVQRAYYIAIFPKNESEKNIFEEAARANSFKFYPAKKKELVTVMRNFILREFLPFDLYAFEQEGTDTYERKYAKKKANKRTVSAIKPDNPADTAAVHVPAAPHSAE